MVVVRVVGYLVVIKLVLVTIMYKIDVGGVVLDVVDEYGVCVVVVVIHGWLFVFGCVDEMVGVTV